MYNVIVETIASGVDLLHVLQSKLTVSQKNFTNGCYLSVNSRAAVEKIVRIVGEYLAVLSVER